MRWSYTATKYYSGYGGGSAKLIVSQVRDISAHRLNQGKKIDLDAVFCHEIESLSRAKADSSTQLN